MSASSAVFSSLAKAGGAIGKGLIAGLAGTIAITISQMVEMQITKRENSKAPVKVGGDVIGVEPKGTGELEKKKASAASGRAPKKIKDEVKANEAKFAQIMHYSYGTGWGVARGAMDLIGVQGVMATLAHFGAIWTTELVLLPAKDAAPPVNEWSTKDILIDVMHHAVYAVAAGLVYDAMSDHED